MPPKHPGVGNYQLALGFLMIQKRRRCLFFCPSWGWNLKDSLTTTTDALHLMQTFLATQPIKLVYWLSLLEKLENVFLIK